MAIVIKRGDVLSFPDCGFFNWGIALLVYVKRKNRKSVLLFKKKRKYTRYIMFKTICNFRASIKDSKVDIGGGGYQAGCTIHTFEKIKEWLEVYGEDKIPVFGDDSKKLIGLAYNDRKQDLLLKNIELCEIHEKDWKIFDDNVGIDVSEIGECNKSIYLLAKKWGFYVRNNNPDWQYIDRTVKITETGKKVLIISDCEKYFSDLVRRNELIDVSVIAHQLRNMGIKVYLFKIPSYIELKEHTKDEIYRHEEGITGFTQPDTQEKEKQLRLVYKDDYELYKNKELNIITQYSRNNIIKLKDLRSKCCNVIDGRRVTTGNRGYQQKIHIYGPCIVGGAYVKDEDTIPSRIQEKLNFSGYHYDVINYGTCGYYRSYISKILNSFIYNGDLVIVIDTFENGWLNDQLNIFLDLKDVINERKQDIFFEEPYHLNKIGNGKLAEKIFEVIRPELCDGIDKRVRIEIAGWNKYNSIINNEIAIWGEKQNKFLYNEGKVYGGIVMNCNPFTYGHLFLIKEALKFVDYLYVFVVEEDKSEFSFTDRYNMVVEGVKGLDNIIVLPSGKWILSNSTMPEYFRKSIDNEQIVCSSDDIEIFAEEISPLFHITKRFVGEEISDKVTKQYNEGMKRILPLYGIELIEIPRKKVGDVVISASTVRRKLQKKDYKNITELVPASTYRYIRKLGL